MTRNELIAIVAALILVIGAPALGVINNDNNTTSQMKACVAAGKSWVESDSHKMECK